MPAALQPVPEAAAPAPAAAPAIALDGLKVAYGKREILHGLTGTFRGRVIGLLGPNGAGKSTLINTLMGFVRPSAGHARVLGLDVAAQGRDVRRQVGYMPENDAFLAQPSAVAFVRLMAELAGLPPDAALERAHEALFYVGLGESRYRKLGGYSLGMKQLAKLAQAIVHGPRLLILDEPTNSLDPPARARMLRLIRQIRDTGECQILLCSHLLRDVEETCDEVVILKQGRIVHHADLAAERRAHARALDLEISGPDGNDVAGFLAAVQSLGCDVAPAAFGRYRLTLGPGVDVAGLYRLSLARGLQIPRLAFRRDSLEDIFLRAMNSEPIPGAVAGGAEPGAPSPPSGLGWDQREARGAAPSKGGASR